MYAAECARGHHHHDVVVGSVAGHGLGDLFNVVDLRARNSIRIESVDDRRHGHHLVHPVSRLISIAVKDGTDDHPVRFVKRFDVTGFEFLAA